MTSLVSDETLGKVVRLVWERPILCADRTAIMTHVLEDQWATALDVAREMLTPEDDAIAALEEANEEAAVTYDDREAKLDAVCRTKLYRGEWIAPGAVPGLARAMAESLGKVTLAAKHPASYEDPRPEVEAKRVALKNAIRAYTVDATGPDGEDVPNGPAEAASVALDKAILQAARILVHYDRTEVSDPLLAETPEDHERAKRAEHQAECDSNLFPGEALEHYEPMLAMRGWEVVKAEKECGR